MRTRGRCAHLDTRLEPVRRIVCEHEDVALTLTRVLSPSAGSYANTRTLRAARSPCTMPSFASPCRSPGKRPKGSPRVPKSAHRERVRRRGRHNVCPQCAEQTTDLHANGNLHENGATVDRPTEWRPHVELLLGARSGLSLVACAHQHAWTMLDNCASVRIYHLDTTPA